MPLPEVEQFILATPLYEKFDVSLDEISHIHNILFFNKKIDCYCTACDKQSTYSGKQETISDFEQNKSYYFRIWQDKIHTINLSCARNEKHLMQISIYFLPTHILKIGQYPSLADISMPDLRKYREVLSKEKYKELSRGVGLVTHGVGVGAFVYLRRIFEGLIEEAHQKFIGTDGWDENKFQQSRMDEKIVLLKTFLPDFLVEQRKLYSILSKGIHELNEDECLQYFSTVKLGIELILDEKLELKRRQDKIALAAASLNQIHNDLSNKE